MESLESFMTWSVMPVGEEKRLVLGCCREWMCLMWAWDAGGLVGKRRYGGNMLTLVGLVRRRADRGNRVHEMKYK